MRMRKKKIKRKRKITKKSETESEFKIDIISKENKIETKENNSNNSTKINIVTDKGNIDLTLYKDIVNIMNGINIEINEEKTQINNMKDNHDEIQKNGSNKNLRITILK